MSSHSFVARWAGVCRACTMPIKVGDRIQHAPSGERSAYVHDHCPAPELIQAGGVTVEAIRARFRVPGSRPSEILIPSAPAVAAATIAARAAAAGSPAPACKPAEARRIPVQASARGRGGRADRAAADPRLPPPGTQVQGRYRGQAVTAEILEGGRVRMEGVEYPTLSSAAKAARGGIPTSGFVFFGLGA